MDSELHIHLKQGCKTFSTSKDLFTRPTINKLFKSKSRLVEWFFYTRLKTTVVDIVMFSVNKFNCIEYCMHYMNVKLICITYSSWRGTIVVIVTVALKKLIMYYELTNLLQRLKEHWQVCVMRWPCHALETVNCKHWRRLTHRSLHCVRGLFPPHLCQFCVDSREKSVLNLYLKWAHSLQG